MKKKSATLMKQSAFALAAMLLLSSAPRIGLGRTSAPAFVGHYTTAFLSVQEQKAGNLLNSDRERYNLPPLTLDPELCRIARIKSEDMRDNQYFAHESPKYGLVGDMLAHFGYTARGAAENIAHHRDIDKAQAALISSPGHRRNILSSGYTRVGVGVATDENGYVYLTQIFCR